MHRFLKSSGWALGLAPLALIGCFSTEANSPQAVRPAPQGHAVSTPYGHRPAGEIKSGLLDGNPIVYEEINGHALYQGDICLTREQLASPGLAKASGTGTPGSGERWFENVIPYEYDPSVSVQIQTWVEMSMRGISDALPHLKFVPHTTEADYVVFVNDNSGCHSQVGKQYGRQQIALVEGCGQGGTAHEILHSLGMWHEQSRADRDSYININLNAINPGDVIAFSQFDKYAQLKGVDLGGFDFNSIMLYDPYAFAANPAIPVMTKKDGSVWTPNTDSPSQIDYASISAAYPQLIPSTEKANDYGAGANGQLFRISNTKLSSTSSDYKIYKYTASGGSWSEFKGAGGVRIDVDPTGKPWVVQASGKVMRWTGSAWTQAGTNLTKIKDIGIGAGGQVIVLSAQTMSGSNYTLWKWNGSSWTSASPGSGLRLSVDDKGRPWTVNALGEIKRWSGTAWVTLPFPFGPTGSGGKDISVTGDGTVYVIGGGSYDPNYYVYQKSGKASDNANGHDAFFELGVYGKGVSLEASSKGRIWIVRNDKTTFSYSQYLFSLLP